MAARSLVKADWLRATRAAACPLIPPQAARTQLTAGPLTSSQQTPMNARAFPHPVSARRSEPMSLHHIGPHALAPRRSPPFGPVCRAWESATLSCVGPSAPGEPRGRGAARLALLRVNCSDRAPRGPSLAPCPLRSKEAALIPSRPSIWQHRHDSNSIFHAALFSYAEFNHLL